MVKSISCKREKGITQGDGTVRHLCNVWERKEELFWTMERHTLWWNKSLELRNAWQEIDKRWKEDFFQLCRQKERCNKMCVPMFLWSDCIGRTIDHVEIPSVCLDLNARIWLVGHKLWLMWEWLSRWSGVERCMVSWQQSWWMKEKVISAERKDDSFHVSDVVQSLI